MKIFHTLQYGCYGHAAISEKGWFAGVLRIEDVEEQIVDGYEEIHSTGSLNTTAILKPGRSRDEWRRNIEYLRREVYLMTAGGQTLLSSADLVGGIATVAGAPLPVVVWTERVGDEWRVMVYTGTALRPVIVDRIPYQNPSAVFYKDKIFFAAEFVSEGQERVGVWDETGTKIFDLIGRSPSLTAGKQLVLAVERVVNPNQVSLFVIVAGEDGVKVEIPVPKLLDYSFNPHIAVQPGTGTCYLAHESSVAWGESWAFPRKAS